MGFSNYCGPRCEIVCEEPCRLAQLSAAADSEYDRRAEREREAAIAELNDAGYGDSGPPAIRTFDTGATRDTDAGKPDYEAYLSPQVIARFGAYMLEHSRQSDGTLRAGDNWQKGIPLDVYMKSMFRHFVDVWTLHRCANAEVSGHDANELEDALCALLFNVQGYLHELLKARA